jgi:metallophosphoesterase superfamily enzyme
VAAQIALGGLVFRHVPAGQKGEVAGHLHPATIVAGRGMSVRRRCFVCDGTRLLLPAFGAYAGGLDVRNAAIASLFAGGFSVYALGRERVYAVGGLHMPRRKKNVENQPSKTAIRTVKTP